MEKKIKNIVSNLKSFASGAVELFIQKYYEEGAYYPVSDGLFGVFSINGDFWSFSDIVYALDNEIPREVLFRWYEFYAEEEKSPIISLKSHWLKEKGRR